MGVSKPVTVLKKSPNKFQLQVKVSSEEAKVLLNGKNVKSVKVDKDGAWSKEFHQFIVEVKKDHLNESKYSRTDLRQCKT